MLRSSKVCGYKAKCFYFRPGEKHNYTRTQNQRLTDHQKRRGIRRSLFSFPFSFALSEALSEPGLVLEVGFKMHMMIGYFLVRAMASEAILLSTV
uniref:Uncharacterized protein n=1 Tax=Picea glauca TaxID=3330 RepID=A0A101M125_PICGL|nr:hypothetical protein ABT39_MTgene4421 [Picea glauca]QHR86248.1 hypothetical protein Q903MT_gene247 [Picea sitchensis]